MFDSEIKNIFIFFRNVTELVFVKKIEGEDSGTGEERKRDT